MRERYISIRLNLMTIPKRIFDLAVAVILIFLICPLILLVTMYMLFTEGRPIFYLSERMRTPNQSFTLIKFRSMSHDPQDTGGSGGNKIARITKTGHFLRRTRLDELPQIFNVFIGDMSFVGPRPPLRQYVEKFPELYNRVLKSRPGITGLASTKFHLHEEKLLRNSQSVEETDAIYSRACIPRKARLDLIYQKNRNLCFDIRIMASTIFKKLL